MNKKNTSSGSVTRHVIITALAGVVYWLIGEGIYARTTAKWFTPLAIAFWFSLFALLIGAVLYVLSRNKTDFSHRSTGSTRKSNIGLALAVLLVLAILAGLFEFLYELGKQAIPEPTSYIFLIDDSGSMSGTEQLRTDGITSIMEHNSSNLPYAVYMFTDHAESIKSMDSYRDGDADKIQFQSDGNTDILGSLDTVLSDLQTGKITGAGSAPRVLLLSDGNSGNYGLKETCEQAVSQGVSVSTVGMGSSNDRMLKRIAGLTGGVFVRCDDASTLGETMETAITSSAERNLLSERFVFKNDMLYAVLRVVFLVLLGVVWSFYKNAWLWEPEDNDSRLFPRYSILLCALGALLLELLIKLGVSPGASRLIFCVLWAITYGHVESYSSRKVVAPNLTPPPSGTGTTEKPKTPQELIGKKVIGSDVPGSSVSGSPSGRTGKGAVPPKSGSGLIRPGSGGGKSKLIRPDQKNKKK